MSFTESLARAALGMIVFIGICYLLSKKRKHINWRTIGFALLMQIMLALLILKVPLVNKAFDWIASMFVKVLQYGQYGSEFLFGDLVKRTDSFGYIFARSEEHTSELQSQSNLVCRLLLEKKK